MRKKLRIQFHLSLLLLVIFASLTQESDQGEYMEERSMLQISNIQNGVMVDTGVISFRLNNDGIFESLSIGEKSLVADNSMPLLSASVLESDEYDGWRDYAPGRMFEAVYQSLGHSYAQDKQNFEATYTGRLEFSEGDFINWEVMLTASSGSPFVGISIKFASEGDFKNRFIRSLSLNLPLALNKRKRMVQSGDRGVQWDTRHWYQYHVSPTRNLLKEPDHNIWRHFAIDQNTEGDYHIWRSESIATSSLTMQRGIHSPGWMAAYDQQGGILFAYRGFSERAPKSLRVMSDSSGEAIIYIWHQCLPALNINSPQAQAVFGERHFTHWMPFAGEFSESRPDNKLAKHWGVDSLASDPPARNEIPLDNLNLLDGPMADEEAPLVSGGIPFPKGALNEPANVSLSQKGGDVPLQTKALAYWPDKSIKWLLLTFPPDGGNVDEATGGGDMINFGLTRRDGSKSVYRLDYGGSATMGKPQNTLRASQDGDDVYINTGPLELELKASEGWLSNVKLNGKEILSDGGRSFVDFLRVKDTYPCMTTHPEGELDNGRFIPETIELEESGPLRAVVKLQGITTSREPTRMIIRLEAYAGRSVIRVFQSAEFLHKDPRIAFIRRMGIEMPVIPGMDGKVTFGGQNGPAKMPEGIRFGLKQHSHLGYTAWYQMDNERFLRIQEIKHRSRGWFDVTSSQGGVTMVLRDMWQQFPNELMVDAENSRMVAYFWPESGPLMDVRRYSNYPHPAQGESARPDSNWVENNYYKKDPFVGVSRTHEMLLYFHEPEVSGKKIDSIAADFQRPPLVHAGPKWYIKTGVLLPQILPGDKRFSRTEANMSHFARFWMHHQKLWGWYGIWDYGDVQHNYKRGYGDIVPPDKLSEILKNPPEDYEQVSVSEWAIHDYWPNQEWAFDNGRWGWSNTEGLLGLYMQNQYMRTGDRDTYFFVEAMARHVRDVDMRHDGMWLGRGTRHGVQHWSDGNHEERQTTHSEFRYHHYLSGDMRSRDFAEFLYEKIYSQRNVSIHAAHSGRLQGLLAWWEMTGGDEVEGILEKYIPCFLVSEGICESPNVSFPDVSCIVQNRDINSGNMFFWTFGAAHGILEYFYLTGHEGLKNALIKVGADAITLRDPGNFRKAVAFAGRHADEPTSYREYLKEWAKRANILIQVVPHNSEFYGGPGGILRGSVPGSLFFMNDLAYILTALDGDPKLTTSQLENIKRVDENGNRIYIMPALSWQSEYDCPDLAEYLRIKNIQP